MNISKDTVDWLLDSDPALRGQVESDSLTLPEETGLRTKALTGSEGFGAALLAALISPRATTLGRSFTTTMARVSHTSQPPGA